MRLVYIHVDGLYGSFNEKIRFNKKLNLLVGINGSGKTSILNCIDWMLRPDLSRLAVTEFKSIALCFVHETIEYVLRAERNSKKLEVSRSGGEEIPPITIDLIHLSSKARALSESTDPRTFYQGMTPELHERPLWSFLSEIPQPLAITLDRSISTETNEGVFVDPGTALMRSKKERKTKSPLEKVSDVTRERYGVYREQVLALNQTLKDRMVMSAFRNPFETIISEDNRKVSLTEISKLENKVSALLIPSIGKEEFSATIAEFFKTAKHVARLSDQDAQLRPIFWSQFKQVDELIGAFNQYEKGAAQAYARLSSYLVAINSFFSQTKKAVSFDDHDGSLAYQFVGPTGAAEGAFRSIDQLSSGEKQILILLTFLAFVSSPNQVFIVDEPELSLHPRWQEQFLEAIIGQSPENAQLILATHSPEIVAKQKQHCIVLGD